MDNSTYILKEFKPFTLQTKVAEVKDFFKKNTYSHFPVVTDNYLTGLISETEICGITENRKTLGDFTYLLSTFFAEEHHNLLEIFKIFAANETNLIPVINQEKKYIGYCDLIDILHIYNNTPFLQNEGAVLLIEKEIKEYSFSEICQIVESNNGNLLGLFIYETTTTSARIMLKFSSQDINEILQSFRRYNYKILSKHKEDFFIEDLKERSEYLQKYLNI